MQVDAEELVKRLTAEMAQATRRAVVAECQRDAALEQVDALTAQVEEANDNT